MMKSVFSRANDLSWQTRILQVPDEIIHEHTPIFTPAGRAMMAALFRISNPENVEGPRKMRLSP